MEKVIMVLFIQLGLFLAIPDNTLQYLVIPDNTYQY
jgi:hypothetical protein